MRQLQWVVELTASSHKYVASHHKIFNSHHKTFDSHHDRVSSQCSIIVLYYRLLWRQDLSRMYLAHHELESEFLILILVLIIIIIIEIVVVVLINIIISVVIIIITIIIMVIIIIISIPQVWDLELISPSEVSRQVAVVIEGEAHKGERHKVHDEGDQPEDSIPNRRGEACHVVSDLGVMLLISGRGFQVLNIILLQVIDAFARWQSLHEAFAITCRQGTAC